MVKKCLICLLALLLVCMPALGAHEISPLTGEECYPDAENWTYRYVYRVPQLDAGETDAAAMLINDTIVTALDEMRQLVLPMFANSEDMTQNGPVTITQDYVVTCNDDHFFSMIMTREEKDDTGSYFTLDADVYDVGGEYAGETLTLRGVVMVGDSSEQLGLAVMPVLYEKFCLLQRQGICRKDLTEEDFYQLCSPTLDYYADENGNAVFFLQPSLMENPSLDVPTFTFTPSELEALAKNVVVPEEY